MLRLVSRVQAVAISSIALNAATIVSGFTVAGTDVVASNRQSLASVIPRRAATANTPRSANALMSRTKTTINDCDSSDDANSSPPLWDAFQPGDYYIWMYTSNGVPSSYERYEVTNATVIVGEESSRVIVEIEMATHFPTKNNEDDTMESNDASCDNDTTIHEEDYNVHHRMQLDLSENLAAIDSRDDWRLMKFDYKKWNEDNGDQGDGDSPTLQSQQREKSWEWQSAAVPDADGHGGENVQAFEEKFDCFAMLRQYGENENTMTSSPTAVDELVGAVTEERECTLNSNLMRMGKTERHRYTGAWYGTESAGRLCGIALFKKFDPEFSFSLIEYGNRSGGDYASNGVVVDVDI